MRTAVLYDPVFRRHRTGEGHPERPQRLEAVEAALERAGLIAAMTRTPARPATIEELALAHTHSYIETARREIESGRRQLSTGDTAISRESWDAAVHAVGGVLASVDRVLGGEVRTAFCAVRPPGHHAGADRGMGFCIFNSIALAARHAQASHKVERVLIADWDVHHGNGTQDIFYSDPSVLFFSTHQWPWYPGTGPASETGEGKGEGATINCPLPAGSGQAEILGAFRSKLLPAAKKFRPELVLVSAGFDSRTGDPLGRFTLSDGDFAELTRVCLEIADQHAGGRLVSVLEGGYALEGLASAAVSHVAELVRHG